MTRITKDPDVRREELIDIAEELFLKNGYEETPVSEIVEKAQVAQGTFYYYFKSKDEVLDAVCIRYLDEFAHVIKEQIKRNDINAVEKLVNVFKNGAQFNLNRKKLMGYVHEEKNALFHLKMERKSYPLIAPLFAKIIERGVKEGLFNVKYPLEAALAMMGSWDTLFDVERFFTMTPEEKKRKVEAAFNVLERIVGVNQGMLAEPFLTMEGVYE